MTTAPETEPNQEPAPEARRTGRMWAMHLGDPLPAVAPSQPTTFGRLPSEAELVSAVGEEAGPEFASRLARGCRCYAAWVGGQLAAYGWVSFKEEYIGEQRLRLLLLPGEAYIWDCVTLPAYRRQGLYAALLAYMAGELLADGQCRVWIGADLDNAPSQRGIQRAGFTPVVDLLEARLLALRLQWLEGLPGAPASLVSDARRALFGQPDQAWLGVAEPTLGQGKSSRS